MSSTIDVNLVTWPNHPKRLEYFRDTVEALQANLTASRHAIKYHCSADSQRDDRHRWYGGKLVAACNAYGVELAWRHEAANLGANMNAALRLGSSDTVLLVQDDWRLLEPLDLSPGIEFMEGGGADLLRYSYPDEDQMRPTFVPHEDGWRRIVLTDRWPYGDDPHLRRRSFMDRWGHYFEGGSHGTASATMMRTLVDGGADIAAADRCYFRHFGDVTAVLDDKRGRRITREDTH